LIIVHDHANKQNCCLRQTKHNDSPGEGGVEETSCIAILQSILPDNTANAKLVTLDDADVNWNQKWDDDERRKWHEHKMKSKLTRAARHLELLGISGTVIHL